MNVKAVLESHAKLKAKIRFTVKEIEDMRGLAENVISNVSESKRAELVGKALDIDKRLTEEYVKFRGFNDAVASCADICVFLGIVLKSPIKTIYDKIEGAVIFFLKTELIVFEPIFVSGIFGSRVSERHR